MHSVQKYHSWGGRVHWAIEEPEERDWFLREDCIRESKIYKPPAQNPALFDYPQITSSFAKAMADEQIFRGPK